MARGWYAQKKERTSTFSLLARHSLDCETQQKLETRPLDQHRFCMPRLNPAQGLLCVRKINVFAPSSSPHHLLFGYSHTLGPSAFVPVDHRSASLASAVIQPFHQAALHHSACLAVPAATPTWITAGSTPRQQAAAARWSCASCTGSTAGSRRRCQT